MHSGTYTINAPGTYNLCLDITGGDLLINASNVTVSNFKIDSGYVAFQNYANGTSNAGLTGITLTDFEMDGHKTVDPTISAISGSNITVERANVHGYGRVMAFWGNDTIADSYGWDLFEGNGSHNEDVLTNGASNITIRHNNFQNSLTQTSAISLFADFGPVQNVTVDDNLLNGGGYTLYGGSTAGKPYTSQTSGIVVTNNHFGRMFYANCGTFGPMTDFNTSAPGNKWSGNVWDDTGAAISG